MLFYIGKGYIIRIRRELVALGIFCTEALGKSSVVATLNEAVGHKTIGICPEDGSFAPLHNGNFMLNKEGPATAPAFWVQIVLDQMDK